MSFTQNINVRSFHFTATSRKNCSYIEGKKTAENDPRKTTAGRTTFKKKEEKEDKIFR
jgi:hypothetical protein